MALATQTASMANSNIPLKSNINGVHIVPFFYQSGTTAFSATAATVLLCKIPTGATVLDYQATHSCGAATCPADYGYSVANASGTVSATLSMFGTAQAKATVNRANKTPSTTAFQLGTPTKLSQSDDAPTRFYYFTGSFAPSSATASLAVQGFVMYTMDGIIPM